MGIVINQNVIWLTALGHSHPVAFVFAAYRGQNRMHAGSATTVEISTVEPRRNLLVYDPFTQRVGQNAFQSVAHLQKHLVVLDEDKQHRAVILFFLADFPRAGHSHGVILDGGVRLHCWEDGNQDLVGALALKIFELGVESRRRIGRNDICVVVEVFLRSGRNDFVRKSAKTKNEGENENGTAAFHGFVTVLIR